jgi:hypothetical protein
LVREVEVIKGSIHHSWATGRDFYKLWTPGKSKHLLRFFGTLCNCFYILWEFSETCNFSNHSHCAPVQVDSVRQWRWHRIWWTRKSMFRQIIFWIFKLFDRKDLGNCFVQEINWPFRLQHHNF